MKSHEIVQIEILAEISKEKKSQLIRASSVLSQLHIPLPLINK